MGKASRTKRERRAAGKPEAPQVQSDPHRLPVKHGVCRSCGALGLISTATGTCTGYSDVPAKQWTGQVLDGAKGIARLVARAQPLGNARVHACIRRQERAKRT